MPKRIIITPHLSIEELEQFYRQAKEPIERSHYQIIWLLAQGKTTKEVAAVTGYSRSWIYELVWGYNGLGPKTLGDGRHNNPEEGYQPSGRVNWKREWLWLYAFVQPQTGATYWWILPYVNTDLFNRVLADFAEEFDVGPNKRIVLPLDQAGW